MNSVSVEQVDATSAPELAVLHANAFTRGWSAESLHALLCSPGLFALRARIADAAAGFILCRCAAAEAEIVTLAVRLGARRRGVGSALLFAALARAAAAGATAMHLEVAAHNGAALALYTKTDFQKTGCRPNYYPAAAGGPQRVDAVLMRRRSI